MTCYENEKQFETMMSIQPTTIPSMKTQHQEFAYRMKIDWIYLYDGFWLSTMTQE